MTHAVVISCPAPFDKEGLARQVAQIVEQPVFREMGGDIPNLVPAEDSTALADALIKVAKDPRAAKERAEAGRSRANSFIWENCVAKTASVYRRVVETAKSS